MIILIHIIIWLMNQKLRRGTKVIIRMNDQKDRLHRMVGIVRYIGPLDDKKSDGDYVGVQIEQPIGKNNGTHNGKDYFKAKPNHGVFLRPSSLLFMNGNPVTHATSSKTGPAKLSKDLGDMMAQQNQKLKKEVQELTNQLKELQTLDWKKELDQLRKKVRQLEDANRVLKIEGEKIKYAVTDKDDGKIQELNEKIQFFKSQKQAIQKEKADLRKKNQQLNSELEECAENMEMVETLTIKIETLEAKNEKLKQQLENASSELRNLRMIGNHQGDEKTEQLHQNIKILNQTITLLEIDLNEEKQKNNTLTSGIENQEKKMGELKKLELKIRNKDEEINQLTQELETSSEAVNFAEKLTLDILKKEEELKETTKKLNEYINKVESLENDLSLNKQLQEEMSQELFSQEELMENYSKTVEQKNNYIQDLNRQIEKYKKKICQLSQTTESMISPVTGDDSFQNREEEIPRSILNIDLYQNKYYESIKLNQHTNSKFLKNQIQFSEMRNQVGVYMLNLHEALPQSFTGKLYPEAICILTAIKAASDKVWYIFEASVDYFRYRTDIFSKENQQLAEWMIVLMKQILLIYSALHKLEFSLTMSDSEEQLSEILSHSVLGSEVQKIDSFFVDLLNRFSEDNISPAIDFQALPLEILDEISLELKRTFPTEHETRMKLCVEGMDLLINIQESILAFKLSSQLGENAEVDNLLQNFIKSVFNYLKQCCMNPYFRYRAEMKNYLKGIDFIKLLLIELKDEGKISQLSSLYSEEESISILKETILTVQKNIKDLLKDLEEIQYPNKLSQIQTILPGKVWQQRIKIIRDELLRFKDLREEKKQLQQIVNELKKKNLLLQRELKEKQNTKQLYQKRIGELQLKVEQSISLENENKRLNEKLKSEKDTQKMIEEEITEQSKRRKSAEEDLKKIKEKYDELQTRSILAPKKNKNMQALSSQDVANLTIFKNTVKECNSLRKIETKKKLLELKYSSICEEEPKNNKRDEESKKSTIRRKGLEELSKISISDPFAVKKSNDRERIVDNLVIEVNKVMIEQKDEEKREKTVTVGSLFASVNQGREAYIGSSKNEIISF